MNAMAIEPDAKDWTWVLARRCDECGFDAVTVSAAQTPGRLRELAATWGRVLRHPDAARRPDHRTWSPLEYAAHVRDAMRLALFRVSLMLDHDDPVVPDWNQDVAAVEGDYALLDPVIVERELVEATDGLADRLESLTPEQWGRPGRRSDGARFTVDSFARYMLHDHAHHVWDVAGRPARPAG